MTDGHGTTVWIQSVVRNREAVQLVGQLPEHTERLGSKGFMYLPHVDVLRSNGLAPRAFAMAQAGAMPMYFGSRAYVAEETTRASGSTSSFSAAPTGQDHGAGAIAQRRGVPRSHLGGPGCGGSLASWSAVVSARMDSSCSKVLPGSFRVPGISTGWISCTQAARIPGGGGVPVGTEGEGVDVLPSEFVLVSHVLSCADHLDVGVACQELWIGGTAGAGPHGVEEKLGPRGANGPSPFIIAQPERDIDSTPAAKPMPSSSARMAWATEMAPVSDEAQKRFMVTAGTESGNPAERAPQRAISPRPS